MVVKALFIGSTLHPIQGLQERANPSLARILCDYAHERWAAGRSITPELWRCVGPFADDAVIDDLRRVVDTGSDVDSKAAGLALAATDNGAARDLLETMPEIAREVAEGRLTWDSLAAEF